MTIEEFLEELREQDSKRIVVCIDLHDIKNKVKDKFKKIDTKDVVVATSLVIFQYTMYLLCTTNNPLRQSFIHLLDRLKSIDLKHLSMDDLRSVFNDDKINKEFEQFKLKEQQEFKQFEAQESKDKQRYEEYVKNEINAVKEPGTGSKPTPAEIDKSQKFMEDLKAKQNEIKGGLGGFDPMKYTEDTLYKFGRAFARGLWDVTIKTLITGLLIFIYHSVDLATNVSFYICLFLCMASFLAYVMTSTEKAKGIMVKACLFYFMMAIIQYVTRKCIDLEKLKYGD